MPMSEQVCARICDRVGWLIPYHLQLVFAALRDRFAPGGPPPTAADVDAAYDRLLSPNHRVHFAPWEERLRDELGAPQDERAIRLLDSIASAPQGLSRDALCALLGPAIEDPARRAAEATFLLRVLEHDGYLVRASDRYLFRAPLLRDFWKGRLQ
jgi:hypothetical protein